MAKKVMITMLDDSAPGFNLSDWVGSGGRNDKGDVRLIQAMINFIAIGHNDLSMAGAKSKNDLPDLSGLLDSTTIFAIMNYQIRWMRLLYASISGVIFPVDYKTYKFTESDTRRPAITMLHQLSMDAAGRLNEADYTVKMLDMFPELRPFIKETKK